MTALTFEQAREALRLADADPGLSTTLATEIVRRAVAEGDGAAAAVAERALGLAAVHVKDLDTAIRHLRRAIKHGLGAHVPQLAAEARMTLAFVLNRRGRSRQALREIDAAILGLEGVEQARAQAQRGAILHQLGRFDEALLSYQRALPALRRAHDHLWLLRALSNRGLLQGHRQRFAAAEADLHEAEQLSTKLDLALWAAFVQQNLGEIHALRGDVPAALHCLDVAETRFRTLRSQIGSLLADRSQLLLSVRLVSEAREAAEQAVEAFERERREIALPEVRLLLARAATLDGDATTALEQARRAMREFSRQQRPTWASLARFVVLSSQLASASGSQAGDAAPPAAARVGVTQVERMADALTAAAWPAEALEARLMAAELAFARGWRARALEQLRLASHGRRRLGPATLRARAWYAEARLRLAGGNRRGVTAAVRAGLRVLDEHRATLGATDLRAHASGHRLDLVELGLRMAMADGDPRRVLAWAEEGRASHLLLRPARPPDDPVLVDALGELRATVAEINQLRGAGHATHGRGAGPPTTTRLVQRQVALERRIRDYCRRQPGVPAGELTGPVRLPGLAGALGEAALLEFVRYDELLYAVTVIDGRVRLRSLGPVAQVVPLVDRIAFALRRLARHQATPASRSAAVALLRHAATGVDTVVLRPMWAEIGTRPLVIIPTGVLQSLPWSILPSCAGRPVTVAPSAALWHAATVRRPDPSGRVVVAGYGLPGAVEEAGTVAAIHGTTSLVGAAATVGAVTTALNGAGVAHLATHGRVHQHNPLFSSLLLADGPLTVYDLERLDRVPRMVILAACDSGRAVVRAGDELLGISATFVARGAQQLVSSVLPVPDAETAPLMVAFHRNLVAGHAAPEALARAQQLIATNGTAAMAAAAGFLCMGAEFRLPRRAA
ncbi:MAG TPA: CHAT domain-containing tetratricopeptide repeat protein [Pilimelia sp.]|nr:CHAT domain-containing tetratricopeptide repeat protein [Pilimelia sp.]